MANFEHKLPTETADIANIVRAFLVIQARFASQQHRPLGRGTHTKGVCARAQFEVFAIDRAVGDPSLAARLSQGLFAKPGVYQATVRFANAASTIYNDAQADVRAMSFAVEVPAGIIGSEPGRLDYSMNNAPTFPINDAHAFASLMAVEAADGNHEQISALLSLPWKDLLGVLKTAVLGKREQRAATRAYQQMRYWSNVPFRHGAAEAVKYSAIPGSANSAQPLQTGPDLLRDEFVRHVNDDAQMSAFDFGLQLLDPARMTRWGRRRSASFWVENATVEWKEAQAPFHIVGRLTLLPKSILPPQECESGYIDVTKHCAPGCEPIGGINRARREAEAASRAARTGEKPEASTMADHPTAVSARGHRRFRFLRWAVVLFLVAAAVVSVGSLVYKRQAAQNIPVGERVDEVRYLGQGWGPDREAADREAYYYTAQGAPLHGMRYSWFVNIERPFRRARLADPDYLRSLNFIVDPVPTPANPDQLPVGFARRYDTSLNEYVLDVSCSACHTGQLNITRGGKTTALRIDGGQGMHAFTDMGLGHFVPELGLSVMTTLANPIKFNRFSERVLGSEAGLRQKARLWGDLLSVTDELIAAQRGSFSSAYYPVQEGFGRTDALARISNTVFGDHISAGNYRLGSAPVNFPFLWNIWKFDWVQYGASVSQPMARNVGEAMGTGAVFELTDRYGRPIPPAERYRTSISLDSLLRIESSLQTLTPPQWPEDLLGSIDHTKAARGQTLYQEHCVGCHGPHVAADALKKVVSPLRTAADPLWVIRWKDVQDIGTDPATAMNFVQNTVDLSHTGLRLEDVRAVLKKELDLQKARQVDLVPALQQELAKRKAGGADAAALGEIETEIVEAQKYGTTDETIARTLDAIDLKKVNVGVGLNILGLLIRDRYYTDRHFSDEARACFEGFGMLDLPQVVPGYKARPHEGVWATPPFLHNGSVPNLYELLSPVAERSQRFFVGRREFDPVKIGYVTEPVAGSTAGFWFDATIPGNLNTGHEFRQGYVPFDESRPASAQYQGGAIGPELTPPQRMDLIEYLKIHKDDASPAPPRTPPDCFALIQG